MKQTFIQLKNVSKIYNGSSRTMNTLDVSSQSMNQVDKILTRSKSKSISSHMVGFKALDKVNLEIEQGSFTIIKGASGSGKSTMLNILSGIDTPSSGTVRINQIEINKLSSNKLAKWRGSNVGIVFQFFQLMPTLSVLENIMLPMEFLGNKSMLNNKAKAYHLLEKLKIEPLANIFPHTLSGGEKQRVAIARALANNPEIIIADEPTGNLDSVNTKIIHELFRQLNKEGKTIIYVTHEQILPKGYNQIINLADGAIVPEVKLELV